MRRLVGNAEERKERKHHEYRSRVGQGHGHRPSEILWRHIRTVILHLAERVFQRHRQAEDCKDEASGYQYDHTMVIQESLRKGQGEDRYGRV